MILKKFVKKKSSNLRNIQNLVPKKLKLKKIKVNPIGVIEDTKKKIGNFYDNFKKEREKEKLRLRKKKKY